MSWEAVGAIIGALALLGGLIVWLLRMNSKIDGKLDKEDHDAELNHCQENCQARIENLREGHNQTITQVYGRIDANRAETQTTLNTLIGGMGELKGMISVLIANQKKANQ